MDSHSSCLYVSQGIPLSLTAKSRCHHSFVVEVHNLKAVVEPEILEQTGHNENGV